MYRNTTRIRLGGGANHAIRSKVSPQHLFQNPNLNSFLPARIQKPESISCTIRAGHASQRSQPDPFHFRIPSLLSLPARSRSARLPPRKRPEFYSSSLCARLSVPPRDDEFPPPAPPPPFIASAAARAPPLLSFSLMPDFAGGGCGVPLLRVEVPSAADELSSPSGSKSGCLAVSSRIFSAQARWEGC